jgi:hypothetical protein
MRFSREEYWSGLPFPPPGDLPNLGIEPLSLMSPVLADRFFTFTWEARVPKKKKYICITCKEVLCAEESTGGVH